MLHQSICQAVQKSPETLSQIVAKNQVFMKHINGQYRVKDNAIVLSQLAICFPGKTPPLSVFEKVALALDAHFMKTISGKSTKLEVKEWAQMEGKHGKTLFAKRRKGCIRYVRDLAEVPGIDETTKVQKTVSRYFERKAKNTVDVEADTLGAKKKPSVACDLGDECGESEAPLENSESENEHGKWPQGSLKGSWTRRLQNPNAKCYKGLDTSRLGEGYIDFAEVEEDPLRIWSPLDPYAEEEEEEEHEYEQEEEEEEHETGGHYDNVAIKNEVAIKKEPVSATTEEHDTSSDSQDMGGMGVTVLAADLCKIVDNPVCILCTRAFKPDEIVRCSGDEYWHDRVKQCDLSQTQAVSPTRQKPGKPQPTKKGKTGISKKPARNTSSRSTGKKTFVSREQSCKITMERRASLPHECGANDANIEAKSWRVKKDGKVMTIEVVIDPKKSPFFYVRGGPKSLEGRNFAWSKLGGANAAWTLAKEKAEW